MFNRAEKILVEIRNESGMISRRKYPIEEDKVVIEAGRKKGKGSGYRPGFENNSILYYTTGRGPFKRLHRKLILMEGAKKCLSFKDGKAHKAYWDRKTERALFEAEVIKSAGATTQKIHVPPFLYILVFAGIMVSVITLIMVMRGGRPLV